MKDLIITTLEALGYEVSLQGTMPEDEPYPESFITFQIIGSPEQDFFDGVPMGTRWEIQVFFYTSNPALMSTVPTEIYNAMKAVGFIPQGKGFDIPSDEPTHTGWVNTYLYLQ